MQIIYAKENPPYKLTKSIFLAGGTLRKGQEGESWRKDALQILRDVGYDGIVFVPETRDGNLDEKFNHSEQVEWEDMALNMADIIVFWVPRDLSLDKSGNLKLPCLTTNVEFGRWESSGKIVLGFPEDAERVSYLKHYADKYDVPVCSTLTETLEAALEQLGGGAERSNGERYIPLHLWKTPSFQDWHRAQTKAGNRLESAQLHYTFNINKNVFLWVLKANVYVAKEDRYKDNELVISRRDISSVLMWKPNEDLLQSEIVLVREFRSPASTEDGMIHELPSGHDPNHHTSDVEAAQHEVQEETGMVIKASRLKEHGARQLAGTLSAHKAHLFSVELTEEEIEWLKSQHDKPHGVAKDGERTYIEVVKLKDALKNNLLDWSNVGMVMGVIYGTEKQ
jgi:8-oxo-dGTP pyrophosphatase MutT (NUDIX family)